MYGDVLRAPGFGRWAAVSTAARLPRAMAPLALVLLGGAVAGSFTAGALLAAAYAGGDVAAATWIGRRLPARAGMLAEAGALAILLSGLPWPLLLVAAALAGAGSAGVPGELRARLATIVPPGSRPAAFSLESTGSAALFAAGPAVTAVLAWADARLAVAVAATIAASGGLLAGRLPARPADRPSPVLRVLRRGWPAGLTGAAFMLSVAGLDAVLPARLGELGASPQLAGVLLAAFAVSGIAGGLAYGARGWPGRPTRQATVLIAVLCLILSVLAVVRGAGAMTAVLLVAGLLGPPVLVARSLALAEALPAADHATGFSALSAASGAGASAAGLLTAAVLHTANATTALLTLLTTTLLLTAAAATADRTNRATRTTPPLTAAGSSSRGGSA